MERLLSMMNIQLPHIVSDIEGAGAMAVINAIAKGETKPEKPVSLLNVKLFKASGEELLESLRGNYRPCPVNMLKEKVSEYNFFVSQMHEYEQYITAVLEDLSVLEEQKRMISKTVDQKQENENENTEVKKRLFKKKRKKRKEKHVKMNISLTGSLISVVFWA
jgi:hypothetical protein